MFKQQVDVLTNAANKNLIHGGGIALGFLRKAG
jgi:O-acetyl-ADP-ribose deacetylase (regulator of RNase III)